MLCPARAGLQELTLSGTQRQRCLFQGQPRKFPQPGTNTGHRTPPSPQRPILGCASHSCGPQPAPSRRTPKQPGRRAAAIGGRRRVLPWQTPPPVALSAFRAALTLTASTGASAQLARLTAAGPFPAGAHAYLRWLLQVLADEDGYLPAASQEVCLQLYGGLAVAAELDRRSNTFRAAPAPQHSTPAPDPPTPTPPRPNCPLHSPAAPTRPPPYPWPRPRSRTTPIPRRPAPAQP